MQPAERADSIGKVLVSAKGGCWMEWGVELHQHCFSPTVVRWLFQLSVAGGIADIVEGRWWSVNKAGRGLR